MFILTEKETKFATLDIVLGILYMVTCAIALFGVIAATMVCVDYCLIEVMLHMSLTERTLAMQDKLLWVRIYAILSFVGGLCVVGAGFNFVYKYDVP